MSLIDLLRTVENPINSKVNLSLDDILILAVKTIEDSKKSYIKPRYKTITSFIRGSNKSPFYDSFYSKWPEICGKFPNITSTKVKTALNILVKQNKLSLKYLDYHTVKKINLVSYDIDHIFMNRDKAKTFNVSNLDDIANWDGKHKEQESTNFITTNDGYDFYYDSKEELSLLKKLSKKSYYISLRGQTLSIGYYLKGKKIRKYHPDIVMLTHDYKIAVIEAKPLRFMSYYQYIIKYNALKFYCENHGYLYAMCDRSFKTFEWMKKKRVNQNIKKYFNSSMRKNQSFSEADFKDYTSHLSTKKKESLRLDFIALIIQNDLINYSIYDFDVRDQQKLSNLYNRRQQSRLIKNL